MANGGIKRYAVLLYEGVDDELINLMENERNKANLLRELLYQELDKRKGNKMTIDVQSYNKLMKYLGIGQNQGDITQNNDNLVADVSDIQDFLNNL